MFPMDVKKQKQKTPQKNSYFQLCCAQMQINYSNQSQV